MITTTAYGTGMVVGTALLIAVGDHWQDTWRGGSSGAAYTEVVMQGAMQKALASPKTAVMAGNELHERRGP